MLNVVFIDDEPYVLSCIPHIVDWSELGFEITGLFGTVSDAKEYIMKNHVDVVFTDISMPDEDGFDIAEFCQKNFPDIKIIFISAYRSFDFAQKAFALNVFDYISKPLTYEAIAKTLTRITLCRNDPENDPVDYDIVNITRKYLEENYTKDISLNQAASHIGLSPAYFSSVYKTRSGESFTATFNNIRIEHAKKLILDKNVKISHINYMVGYQSRSYFFKIFKRICGVSPTEYRAIYLKKTNS